MGQLSGIKISAPTYSDVVPSTKQKVKLTPFRVGDEKTLMIAAQSKNTRQMIGALKKVLVNCVDPIDIDEIAPFDMEYLFIKLRAISVGETANVGVKCSSCEEINPVSIDLSKVKVHETPGHTNLIKISKELAFEMRYPDMDLIDENFNQNDIEQIFELVASSVKKVYHNEDVIEIGLEDRKDLIEMLDGLSTKQFAGVQEFFATAPKMKETVTFNCKSCKTHNEQTLEGLSSFF